MTSLDSRHGPQYLKDLEPGELAALAAEIRDRLISTVSANSGRAEVRGKDNLDDRMRNYAAVPGRSTYTIDRLIEEGRREFRFRDAFTFSGDAISRVDTYRVSLNGPAS
jgi:hypothetical protein